MMNQSVQPGQADSVESVMRMELMQGDAMLGSITPILRHLLANDDHSVFGDEIIARVRGVLADLVGQLLDELAKAGGTTEKAAREDTLVQSLVHDLIDVPGLMTHIHALAMEWQLNDRLQARLGLDPVLSPLLQALIASPDTVTAGTAMNLLASQARFIQSLRRMQLPLTELPGDLLHGALLVMRTHVGSEPQADALGAKAEAAIRARYDESRCRLGLIARLVTGMGGGAVAALSITHAGIAIFASALSIASGQDRDLAVLCTNENQLARLALALRASGLKTGAVEEQFLSLHPDVALPEGFDALGADRAAAILAVAGCRLGT
ncbi:MAG: hypothetical protein KGL44_00355 [Sphingomonadales bacterium]|nr:hypothetical protein [Sphingomonadales bacterium]